jgi:DNA-binding CsgD family transcriptional regulator
VEVAIPSRQARAPKIPARTGRLTQKELAVLRELASGKQTDEIGEVLFLSPHTVRSHVKSSMKKLDARTRAQAVAVAVHEGAIRLALEEPAPGPSG